MARPNFPNTFDTDSPLSPQSGSGSNTPISYRTNVNRQKTTKWTQAKAVDYGGDDWGDDDEYDLPPPPISKKPTGLRQQGQGLPSQSQGNQPSGEDGKKSYGQLPGGPPASNPRGRTNSFGADEERNFSSATIRQPSPSVVNQPPSGPATRFSQITGVPSTRNASGPPALSVSTQSPTGLRKPSQAMQPVAESPNPDIPIPSSEPASATTTQTALSDYQNSRDYSPSAVPPPLSTRPSPAPQSPQATRDRSQSATRFPARKSSLSQSTGPPGLTTNISAAPAETAKSPTTPTTGKKLPFIRPADIYKRAEEERQSMESGRPSMDSIMGTRGNESGESPARRNTRERTDSLGSRHRSSMDDEGSDSGRRLMPILDTVKERKSEYGFDGFNVNEPAERPNQGRPTEHEPIQSSTLSQPGIEDMRSHSTSPKLPDLNRISGFGMDMFSSTRTDSEETPRASETATPPPANENTLHSQPSIGLRSVVHQAFDRSDDSSVPPTPASRTGSGVRRTDSESTGTTGISPIMSRVPSTAIPNAQNRDHSTPAILEVVDEPASPDRSKSGVPTSDATPLVQPQPVVPGFKPGHRRDISAPSPGNSPARTPDLATSSISSPGHEVVITDASPSEQSRPLAEREQSFRPTIPGGWTSYAASSRSDSTQQEGDRGIVRKPTPVNEPSTLDDHELTPTTTRDAPQFPSMDRGNALPTPDPAMAPSGNLYSNAPLDPRLLPKLEHAPMETELRPDAVHRDSSAHSSAAPTPPPKDTPLQPDSNSSYFPHNVDQQRSQNFGTSDQTQALPTFVTDNESQEDENERLREEIVKTLTPKHSSGGHDNVMLSAHQDDPPLGGQDRDSAYLPSEYDNYWESTADEGESIPAAVRRSTGEFGQNPSVHPDSMQTMDQASIFTDSETPPIPPLNSRRISQQIPAPTAQSLQHRFSWERSTETVPEVESPMVAVEPEPVPSSMPQEAPMLVSRQSDHSGLILDERRISGVPSHTSSNQEHHTGRDATLISGGAVLGAGAIAVATNTPHDHSDRRQSLAEEKDPRVSSNPVSPTPPEFEHPAMSPQAHTQPPTDQSTHISPAIVSPPQSSPTGLHGAPHERLMAFKEIAALKSQQQRIETFDATRQRYAAMESGLSSWIESLQAQHPEHADTAGWGNTSRFSALGTSSAKTKFAKVTGTAAPSTQQPYYQQYLNASSPTTPTTPGSRPGPSTQASGGQQGFSPAGGKLTSQQVQAKGKELGKELFHTAGIFGGKAGKAGKGLLAKGKSRFRGSGGGDKTSPTSKNPQRRSSWGPLLTLSRPSGHPESAHQAAPNIPVTGASNHPSTPDMQRRASSPHFSNLMGVHRAHTTSGDISTTDSPTSRASRKESYSSSEVIHDRQAHPEGEIDARSGVQHVASVSQEQQPSWDPSTATTIADEEAIRFHVRPIHPHPQVFEPNDTHSPGGHLTPGEDGLATSTRSSGDTRFYSVPDGSPEMNEWVMVSPGGDANYFPPTQVHGDAVESSVLRESHADDSSRQSTTKAVDPENGSTVSLQRGQDERDSTTEPQHTFAGSLEPKVADLPTSEHVERVEGLREPGFDGTSLSTESNLQSALSSEPEIVERHTPVSHVAPPVISPEHEVNNASSSIAPKNHYGGVEGNVSPESDLTNPPLFGEPPSSSVNVSGVSILNRPRGSTIEDLPPSSPRSPTNPIQPPNAGDAPVPTAMPEPPRQQVRQQQESNSSFLPPIRRTSTFGIGFGSRQKQTRFPIDDEDEHIPAPQQPEFRQPQSTQHGSISEYTTSPGPLSPLDTNIHAPYNRPPSGQQDAALQHASIAHTSPTKPRVVRVGSSEYNQSMAPQQQNDQQFTPNRLNDVQPTSMNNFRRSQDSWRPPGQSFDVPQAQRNGQLAGPIPQNQPFQQPPSSAQRYPGLFRSETGTEMPEYEQGRERDLPAHYYQQPIAREEAFLPRQQTNEYQIPGVGPPTDLPRPGSRRNSGNFFRELGGRISRGTSRERTGSRSRGDSLSSPQRPFDVHGNEYAESSVASEEGREQNNKRASFFGNLNRASTVGLGPPQSRESVLAHHSGSRTDLLSSGQQSPIQDQKKRSFFGSSSANQSKPKASKLSRSSTSGMLDEPGKKKRFSGLTGFFGKSENSASRISMPPPTRPSGFKQGSYNERPAAQSPQLSQYNSSVTPPNLTPENSNQHLPPGSQRPPLHSTRGSSRSGGLLSKLTSTSSIGLQGSQFSDAPRKDSKSKPRRSSTSGLLNGFMGRKNNQQDREREESRSQGSSSQPQAILLPPAQTYTDLQEQQPLEQMQQYQPPTVISERVPSYEGYQYQAPDRGRRVSREPQYDNVPIPGGYALVRPQGAMVAPTTYDPKGLNRSQQSDPRYQPQVSSPSQQQSYSFQNNGQNQYNEHSQYPQQDIIHDGRPAHANHSLMQRRTSEINLGSQYQHQQAPQPQQTPVQEYKVKADKKPPHLRSLETFETYQARSARRLSSEEELARSPARLPEGQQRPYQLSLPGNSEEDHPVPIEKDHIVHSHNTKPQHHSVQRLQQQPILRHPGSPAGYPVPDSTFSPVNPQAHDLPPPSPPKGWESQSSHLDPQFQPPNSPLSSQHNGNLSIDLDRSNTRRTAVSAISQVSIDDPHRGRSSIPTADEKDMGANISAESSRGPPSRTSPVITPEGFESPNLGLDDVSRGRRNERGTSRENGRSGGDEVKTTTIERGPSPDDLYDASPLLPKQGQMLMNKASPKPSPIQTNFATSSQSSQIQEVPLPVEQRKKASTQTANTYLAPGSHQNKQVPVPEEKIYYDSNAHARAGGEEGYFEMDAEPTVSMSATSYPGQEWNPYAGVGGYEED